MNDEIFIRQISIDNKGSTAFPFCLPSIENIEEILFDNRVTFIVGENGSGKSTLLEAMAIALGFNPEGGSKNYTFSTTATHSNLHESIRIKRSHLRPKDGFFFRAESYYNLASNIDELDSQRLNTPLIKNAFGGKSLHAQSHGESFLSLLVNRFFGNGLYILDEPESALSPSRQLTALSQIHELVKASSQFIIATHSPILLSYPNATIYNLDDSGLTEMNYTETEHYQVTKYFINNTEKMLEDLFR